MSELRQREKGSTAGLTALYRLVDWPPLYEFIQLITAPGAHIILPRKIRIERFTYAVTGLEMLMCKARID